MTATTARGVRVTEGGEHNHLDEPAAVVTSGRWSRDEEFSDFMRTAEPLLGRMAWLLCGDLHLAEELVQQVLVRTYVAWPRARAVDPLAYARRALMNQRIDNWRRRRREVLVEAPEPTSTVASHAQQHAERDALVRALLQLSPRRRRVVVLRYLMDLSEREVADDLSISVGTVKSTASRGIAQLRALLVDMPEPLGAARPPSGAPQQQTWNRT